MYSTREKNLSNFSSKGGHYGRTVIPRVPGTSPSAKNRALGEANLPRVLHSGKRAFPECREGHGTLGKFGTRGKSSSPRATLGEGGTRKMNLGFDGDGGRNRLEKNGKHLP
jgi:hypothetical protein